MKEVISENVCFIKQHGLKIFSPLLDEWHRAMIIWVGTVTGYCLGNENYQSLIVLLVLIVIDFVTGLMASFKNKREIRSSKLPATAVKTVIYFSIIVTARLTGTVLDIPSVEKLIIMFYITTEAYSIIENAHLLGVPVPQMFHDALRKSIERKDKHLNAKSVDANNKV